MARPKGSPKLGGRSKGTPNRATAKREAEIAAAGITPLDYMLARLRDELASPEDRFEAAKAAAPYVHPKLAAVTHANKDGEAFKVDGSLRVEFVTAKHADNPVT